MIGGNANLFGSCQLSSICLRGDRFFWIPVMSQDSEPYSSGVPFWASVSAPKFSLHANRIWLLFCAAFCVRLKENAGFPTFLTGFMISLLIIVTIHVALNFCVRSNLLLMIFSFIFPCLGIEV